MDYFYIPIGTCSKKMTFSIIDGKILNLKVQKGCAGNLIALGRLIEGKDIDEVINLLKGISCPGRKTSCPDQLALALISLKESNNKQ